jgi:hypothetical protein
LVDDKLASIVPAAGGGAGCFIEGRLGHPPALAVTWQPDVVRWIQAEEVIQRLQNIERR